VQIGVAFVTVTPGTNANERNVVAVGWVPTNTGTAPMAHQKLQATVSQFLFKGSPPPASLTVRGEVGISGNSNIDSRGGYQLRAQGRHLERRRDDGRGLGSRLWGRWQQHGKPVDVGHYDGSAAVRAERLL
jgi:hypothetical protein